MLAIVGALFATVSLVDTDSNPVKLLDPPARISLRLLPYELQSVSRVAGAFEVGASKCAPPQPHVEDHIEWSLNQAVKQQRVLLLVPVAQVVITVLMVCALVVDARNGEESACFWVSRVNLDSTRTLSACGPCCFAAGWMVDILTHPLFAGWT